MATELKDLLEQFRHSRISRREFIARGLVAGASLATLSSLADGAHAQTDGMAGGKVDRKRLEMEVSGVLDALTSRPFVQHMLQFKGIEGNERLAYAMKYMTPSQLRQQEVPLPKGMRVSSREFEEGMAFSGKFLDYERGDRIRKKMLQGKLIDLPLKWTETASYPDSASKVAGVWGCACGGAATICGGAGGGTSKAATKKQAELASGYESELKKVMASHYTDLLDFVTEGSFSTLVERMYKLKPEKRPKYVMEVLTNEEVLGQHGIKVPHGIRIQRSSFGDLRPTLFVVKKYLPEEYQGAWENVNITFDQDFPVTTYSEQKAWQKPLPFDVQAVLSAYGVGAAQLDKVLAPH